MTSGSVQGGAYSVARSQRGSPLSCAISVAWIDGFCEARRCGRVSPFHDGVGRDEIPESPRLDEHATGDTRLAGVPPLRDLVAAEYRRGDSPRPGLVSGENVEARAGADGGDATRLHVERASQLRRSARVAVDRIHEELSLLAVGGEP
jgi:hypothetical protein